jgi:hypothetical protein
MDIRSQNPSDASNETHKEFGPSAEQEDFPVDVQKMTPEEAKAYLDDLLRSSIFGG